MSDYTKVYNKLITLAQKRDRDQITAKEWNTMVGTLALQLNTMGANLDVVHEQLVEIEESLPSTGLSSIVISKEEPEDLPEGGLWFEIIN